jgi:prepilin-type processing-associated H-X9-DG protein
VLDPYIKSRQIWACPTDSATRFNTQSITAADARAYKVSYGYNYSGIGNSSTPTSGNVPGTSFSDSGIVRPAELCVLWDSRNLWSDGSNFWARDVTQYLAKNFDYTCRHLETGNFLYADGHVKAHRLEQLKYRNIGNYPEGDAVLDRSVTANNGVYTYP